MRLGNSSYVLYLIHWPAYVVYVRHSSDYRGRAGNSTEILKTPIAVGIAVILLCIVVAELISVTYENWSVVFQKSKKYDFLIRYKQLGHAGTFSLLLVLYACCIAVLLASPASFLRQRTFDDPALHHEYDEAIQSRDRVWIDGEFLPESTRRVF